MRLATPRWKTVSLGRDIGSNSTAASRCPCLYQPPPPPPAPPAASSHDSGFRMQNAGRIMQDGYINKHPFHILAWYIIA